MFGNTAAFDIFASDTVTITRGGNTGGANWGVSTVYDGPGDLQQGAGSTFYNPAGVAEVSDAVLIINASPLPAALVGDIVTRGSDGKIFSVASVATHTSLLPHLELQLHVGPVKDDQQQP